MPHSFLPTSFPSAIPYAGSYADSRRIVGNRNIPEHNLQFATAKPGDPASFDIA